ncbi:hypothetical protein OE88DRAFT_1650439 [Heliocybe sulcata]|uniref:Uncharacterized protein n=1 Tax=Heliocybe sulcata TaxID=5364 RepID=A0A5C3NHR7_9AGAM|nr:hypothetical protein OE88DRAFT_1650439 [Heliocybe sulcata]
MTTLKVINRTSVKDRCTTCPDLDRGRAYTQGGQTSVGAACRSNSSHFELSIQN